MFYEEVAAISHVTVHSRRNLISKKINNAASPSEMDAAKSDICNKEMAVAMPAVLRHCAHATTNKNYTHTSTPLAHTRRVQTSILE